MKRAIEVTLERVQYQTVVVVVDEGLDGAEVGEVASEAADLMNEWVTYEERVVRMLPLGWRNE